MLPHWDCPTAHAGTSDAGPFVSPSCSDVQASGNANAARSTVSQSFFICNLLALQISLRPSLELGHATGANEQIFSPQRLSQEVG
jgi:hypothetical protein